IVAGAVDQQREPRSVAGHREIDLVDAVPGMREQPITLPLEGEDMLPVTDNGVVLHRTRLPSMSIRPAATHGENPRSLSGAGDPVPRSVLRYRATAAAKAATSSTRSGTLRSMSSRIEVS